MKTLLVSLALAASALAASPALAQNVIADPWIRATVAQQKATGMFMKVLSKNGARLVSVSSPVAGLVELHEMSMDGNVMKMRALSGGIDLPAGKPVSLQPGGLHVMLMDLKQPLKPGDQVPVTLVIENADKTRDTPTVNVTVRALDGSAAKAADHAHGHKH